MSLAVVVEWEVALVGHILPLPRTGICVTRVWGRNYITEEELKWRVHCSGSVQCITCSHLVLDDFHKALGFISTMYRIHPIGASLLRVLPSMDLCTAFLMIKEAEDGSVLLMM